MNFDVFNKIVDSRILQSAEILKSRGEQYSRNGDRLHNFKSIARIKRITSESACLGLMLKQFVNLMDLIEDLNNLTVEDDEFVFTPLYDELFNDLHNYLYLLEGLLKERV